MDNAPFFSAGIKGKPATLSFLAPAQDERRSITSNRKKAMALIGVLYSDLNNELPGGMGLYDDAFNINCTGDTFQSLGVPTILFEAGHYPSDYDREKTRYFVFRALLSLVNNVNTDIKYSTTIYDQIPLNEKSYLDVLIRNVLVSDETKVDIGIQFEERLEGNSIRFIPKVEHLTLLEDYLGHKEIDAQGDEVIFSENKTIEVGDEIDFVIIKNEKILIKP